MAMSDPRPTRLTTEHASAPLDVDVAEQRLSWQLGGGRGGAVQHAYQIVVGPGGWEARICPHSRRPGYGLPTCDKKPLTVASTTR